MPGGGPGGRRSTNVPSAGPPLDQTLVLQLPVALEDGVGVDRELGDDLLDGRQLVAGLQEAGDERLADLLRDLQVRRDAGLRVEPEGDQHRIPK